MKSLTVNNQKCVFGVISTKVACFTLVFSSIISTDIKKWTDFPFCTVTRSNFCPGYRWHRCTSNMTSQSTVFTLYYCDVGQCLYNRSLYIKKQIEMITFRSACLHLWLQVFLCQVDKTLQFKCVVPENIQTPTMEGTLLRTPHLPGFSIFAGNWWTPPPTPLEFPQVRQRPPNQQQCWN